MALGPILAFVASLAIIQQQQAVDPVLAPVQQQQAVEDLPSGGGSMW